ncbi:hypothetical protein DYB32_004227 [Aphanomyces invadans]|uniref:Fibronectin type-III domain-containing protein n=1 Tax=Aphanomyces invadans TaxID=157072 RepID=A0A3R6Z553_9STRA|nr:hypothetical protein DYB32_004227 [Aphanomyces invadans]
MTVPSPPLNVQLVEVTSTVALIQWVPPVDFGGTALLTGYQVQRQKFIPELNVWSPSEVAQTMPLDGRATQAKVINLSTMTLYMFSVVALNPVSACVSSDAYNSSGPLLVRTTVPTRAEPPTNVVFSGKSGSSLSLTWTRPFDDGGAPISGYAVYTPNGDRLAVVNGTSFTQFGLNANTTYSFWITTITSQGESAPSNIATSKTTLVSAPSAPRNIVQVNVTGGMVTLQWDFPADDGGGAIFGYNLYRNGALLTSLPLVQSYVDRNGLQMNQKYVYALAAINAFCEGSQTTITAITNSVPGVPQMPLLTVSALTGGMVIVRTTLPSDMGGAPFQSTRLQLLDSDSQLMQEIDSVDLLDTPFYGLHSFTRYILQGQITTTGGVSALASIPVITTNITVPSPPSAPIVKSATGGSIQLSLFQALDQGGENATMILSHKWIGSDMFERVPFQVAGTRVVTVSGLNANRSHQFWTTSFNSAGESFPSPSIMASTTDLSLPEQVPDTIQIVSKSYRSLTTAWTPILDNGGDSVNHLSYNICVTSSTHTRCIATTEPAATINDLTAETSYTLQVQAINSVGGGPWSVVSSVTTDDAVPGVLQFVAQSVQVLENSTTIVLVVSRTSGTANTISCTIAATSGSAVATTNYVFPDTTSLTFVDGETAQEITIQIVNNEVVDPPRFFDVALTGMTSETGALGTNQTCRVTILDDGDAGQVSFRNTSFTIFESQSNAVLELRRTPTRTSGTLTIQASFRQAQTAVAFLTSVVSFADGQTAVNLTLVPIRDELYNYPFRTALVDIAIAAESAGAVESPSSTTVFILDNVDVAAPDDAGIVPIQVSTSGGFITVQVPPPRHVGGWNQSLVSYRVNMTNAMGQVVSSLAQHTSVFSFGGLNFSTLYTFQSAVMNRAGLLSMGSGTVDLSTGPMSLPSPPTNVRAVGATGGSIDVCWALPQDSGGIPITGYQIEYLGAIVFNGTTPCAHISNLGLQANASYSFNFYATNFVGVGPPVTVALPTATNATLPAELAPPSSVVQGGGDSLVVQFRPPGDTGGIDILRYLIYINTTNTTDQTTTTSIFTEYMVNSTGRVALTGLSSNTLYIVKYTAWNALGGSSMSSTYQYTTGPPTIPSEPRNLRLDRTMPTTGACIPLIWDTPESTGGLPLAEYHIYVTKFSSSNDGEAVPLTNATQNLTFTKVFVGPATTTSTIVCGFDQRTSYVFKALAYNAESFCSGGTNDMPFSQLLLATTSNASVPSRPDPPQVVASTGGMITLAWSLPRDTGGAPLRRFDVYLIASNGSMLVQRVTGTVLAQTCDVTGLDELKTYEFQLTAANDIGVSAPSLSVLGRTTTVTSPSKPLNMMLVSPSGGSILVSWQAPQDTGGRPIVSYFVYRDSVKIGDSYGTTAFLDQSNLMADSAYSYFVIAYTSVSYGRQSDTFVARTSSGSLPGLCTNITAEATGGSLSVAWLPPQNSGGLPIVSYTAALFQSKRQVALTTTAKPAVIFNLLQNGTTYLFIVNATNAIGSSAAAHAMLTTTTSTAPGAPPSAPLAISIFGGNATLSLDLSPDTGGETTNLSYVVFLNDRLVVTVPSFGTRATATIYGLVANTTYRLTYACSNIVGLSTTSPTLLLRTAVVNAPGFMQVPSVRSTTSRTIMLDWIPPADTGGSTVLRYEIDVAGTSWVFANVTSGLVMSLQPESTYSCRIRAVSMTGGLTGPWSAFVQIATAPASAGKFTFGTASSSVLKNASTFTLPIYRIQGSVGAVRVTLTTSNNSLIGTQFVLDPANPTATRRTIAFDDGTVQVNVVLKILNDGVYTAEGVSILLRLVEPMNFAALSTDFNSTTLVLQDAGAAGQINFVSTTAAILESASTLILPLSRIGGTSSIVQVLVRVVPNTHGASPAAIGVDYRLPTTPIIRFDDGDATANVSVIIRNNNFYSFPPLGFTLQLVVFSGGAIIGANCTVAVTLLDDGDVSPPSPPGPPTVVSVTGGSVELALVAPVNKGYKDAEITQFQAVVTNTTSTIVDAGGGTRRVGGLLANTKYELSVQAANDAFTPTKFGGTSPTVVFTTGAPSMNGPPSSLQLVYRTGGSLKLTWSIPLDTGGVPILRYRVKWTDELGVAKTGETLNSTYSIFQLRSNSSYIVQVQQCNNGVPNSLTQGWGPYSAPELFQTSDTTLPGPPTQVVADPVRSGGSVSMTWNSPLDTGGQDISQYLVVMKLANESNFHVAPNQVAIDSTRIKVSGLYANTMYNFRVMAQNTMGDVVLPGAFNISNKALSITSSADVGMSWIRFKFSWSPPADTGGVNITQYTLQMFNESIQEWATKYSNASTTCRVAKLATKTSYRWRLQAANSVGISDFSSVWTYSTSVVSPPGPCRSPIQMASTGGMISVSWDPPDDNGGSDVTSYILEYSDSAAGPSQRIVTKSTSTNIYGLRALTTYTVKVMAVNRIGAGEAGIEGTMSTGRPSPPNVPDPPVITESSGGALVISMKPPLDIGGVDPATLFYEIYANGYVVLNISYLQLVEQTNSESNQRRLQASQGSGVTVGGLDSNKKYRISVAASSPAGSSPKSIQNEMSTSAPTVPGIPNAPTVIQANGGSLVVGWTSPADEGGASVSSFQLFNLASPSTPVCQGLIWQCIVTGLLSNSAYEFVVVAQNSIGLSPQSDILKAKTTLISTLGPPQRVRLVSLAANGQVATIAWSPPQDTGGLTLSGYTCTAEKASDHSHVSVTVATTEAQLSLLSPGATYTVTCVRGGIYADESVITFARSSVSNCSGSQGGGVYAANSRLSMHATRVTANQATDGGGIFVSGVSDVRGNGAIIADNQASNTGGGVVAHGVVYVTGMTITANTAMFGAGATLSGQVQLEHAALDANHASQCGGGLYTQAALDLTSNDVMVSNNAAVVSGGGLYVHNTTLSVVSVTSVFQHNQARDGGGIYLDASNVSLDGVMLTAGNATTGRGGGIATFSSDVLITRSSVDGNFARVGGGVSAISDSKVTLVDVNVVNNMARFGGGISVDTSVVVGGVVQENVATEGGGGILLKDGSIRGAQIRSCDTLGHGGGLYVSPSTFNSMTDIQVTDSASSGNGGGMYCENTSVALFNVHFIGNNASQHGGGLFLSTATVTGRCHATNCSAALSGGGVSIVGTVGIDAVDIETSQASIGGGFSAMDSTFVVHRSNIVANAAATHGGGAYIRDCQGVVDNWDLRSNTAGINGGGLIIITSNVLHNNLMVVENQANNFAGGMYIDGSSLVPKAPGAVSTVHRNRAYNGGNVGVTGPSELVSFTVGGGLAVDGGGMYLIDSTSQLEDLAITGNHALNNGGGMFIKMSTATLSSTLVKENSAVYGGGIALSNANVYHANVSVILNQAGSSGGLHMGGTSSFHSRAESTISQNDVCMTMCGFGGNIGVYEFSNASISGVVVSNGTSNYGGGLFVFFGGNAVMTNVAFRNNVAAFGGAYSAYQRTNTSFENCSIEENTATTSGGAVFVPYPVSWSESSTISMVDCHFVRNIAQQGIGGAIYIDNVYFTAERTRVEANHAIGNDGGGLYAMGESTVSLMNCQFLQNFVLPGYSGGGISAVGKSTITVSDSLFEGPILSDEDTMAKGGLIFISQERTKVVLLRTRLQVGHANFGGGVYISDGHLDLTDSTIDSCKALQFGGALHLTSSASAVLTNASVVSSDAMFNGGGIYVEAQSVVTAVSSTIEDNYADDQGGGIFVAIGKGNAYGTLTDTIFVGNIASNGGALQIQNTAQVQMERCLFTENTALVSGGAIYQRNGNLNAQDTSFDLNRAPSGGAVYMEETARSAWTNVFYTGGIVASNRASIGGGIFASEDSILHASNLQGRANIAQHSGGAFYLNDTVNVQHTDLEFESNDAPLGRDIFWRYKQTSPSYACSRNCRFDTSRGPSIATDPMNIEMGWWPAYATSGVPMTTSKLDNTTLEWDNSTNTSVPWPTIVVVDFYGHRSILDQSTVCRVYKKVSEQVKIMFLPNSQVVSTSGFVTFQDAEVQTDPKEAPFEMEVECRLYNHLTRTLDLSIKGYFLADAPPTSLEKLCDIATYFPSGDPCPGGTELDRLDRMRRCMNNTDFKQHWDENRIFTCSSGFMFYACPVTEACKGSISKSELEHVGRVCQIGYTSPLCGSCDRNYQKMQDGTCVPCDEVSRNAFYGYVTIPILMIMAGLYAIAMYLHHDTDNVLMAQARAATENREFQTKPSESKLMKLEAAVHRVRKALRRTWKRLVTKAAPKKKLPNNLFGIEQIKLPTLDFSPEKFKILLSFFQIFSNLKDTYQISWPQDVAYFMAFVSKFNFDFMSVPHLDCMIDFSFYGNFRLTLATAAISFALLHVTYRWGVFVYKRKLHKIPRHCTLCGLPNTAISTETRVSAIRQFAMEIERDKNQSKIKKLFSRFLLSIEKDEVKNAMPTYLSNHIKCPTTERVTDPVLRQKILHTNIQLWQARVKLRLNFRTYTDKLALFMYPAVSQKILNMFNCTQVGQGSFLVADMTLSCTDGYWYSHAIVAVIGLVVWVFGVPFYCWSILFQERMAGVRIRMRMLKDNKHEELRQKWIAKMKADYKATGRYWHTNYDAFANMLLHEYMKKRNMEVGRLTLDELT